MDRRQFIAAAAATAVTQGTALGATAPAVHSIRRRDIVMALPWPSAPAGYADIAYRLARRLEHAMAGAIRIQLVVDRRTAAEVLAGHEAALHFGVLHADADHTPALAWFAGLPGDDALSAALQLRWWQSRDAQALRAVATAPLGFVSMMAGHTGASAGLWARSGLWARTVPASLSGMRIPAAGAVAHALTSAGARVTRTHFDDLGDAIRRGDIDAADAGGFEGAASVGLRASESLRRAAGLLPHGSVLALSATRSFWEALQAEQRACFARVASSLAHETIVQTEQQAALAEKLPSTIPDSQQASCAFASGWTRLAQAAVADFAGRNPLCGRVNASYFHAKQAALATNV